MDIAFEGLIGVGKTTLAKAVAQELGVGCLTESDLPNPLLEQSYLANDERWNLACQLRFLMGRLAQFQSPQLATRQHVVSDHSLIKELIFAGITIHPDELPVYHDLYQQLLDQAGEKVWKPRVIVYLRSTLETTIDRILGRGRAIEKRLTRSYLQKIEQGYQQWLNQAELGSQRVVVVSNEAYRIADDPAAIQRLLSHCEHTSSGVSYCNPV